MRSLRGGLDIDSGNAHTARRRREITCDDLHGRGFAGAVGAQESKDFPFGDCQIDAANRGDRAEILSYVFNFDHRLLVYFLVGGRIKRD